MKIGILTSVAAICAASFCAFASTALAEPLPDTLNLAGAQSDGYDHRILEEACSADPASCCRDDQKLVSGSGGRDFLVGWGSPAYCVMGLDGKDTVFTRRGNDTVWGGEGRDWVFARGGNDIVFGGAGNDFLSGGRNGTLIALGGEGDDHIQATHSHAATLIGGWGDDYILGGRGNDLIRPGPGHDHLVAGRGDDIVVLSALCEIEAGEFLHGGKGTDTLVTPVSLAELEALGVTVISFENILVQERPCESECATCLQRVNPTSGTDIPGYDPGLFGCDPRLELGALQYDSEGRPYYDSVDLVSPTVAPARSDCPTKPIWCDANGNPISDAEGEARLQAVPTQASSCEAVGGTANIDCPIDPSSFTTQCGADGDCGVGEVCTTECLNSSCTDNEKRCGRPFESCAGLPAVAEFCQDDLYLCAEPDSVGTLSSGNVRSEYPDERDGVPGSEIDPEDAMDVPQYATGGYCDNQRHALNQKTGSATASDTKEGSDKWGVYFKPNMVWNNNLTTDEVADSYQAEVGGSLGLQLGALIWGVEFEVLELSMSASAQTCGVALGAQFELFDDSIATFDRDGLNFGLSDLDDNDNDATTPVFKQKRCNDLFDERNERAGDLRKAMFAARGVQKDYFDHGVGWDNCSEANKYFGLNVDCTNLDPVEDIDLINVWQEEYEKQANISFAAKTDLTGYLEGEIAVTGVLTLHTLRERYSLLAVETSIPVGPVSIKLAADAYGEWFINGDLQAGIAHGKALTGFVSPPPLPPAHEGSVHIAAGPIVTPGAGLHVAIFAGVGIPGVAVGVEGDITIVELSVPFHSSVGLARTTVPDPRDLSASAFAGEPLSLPVDEVYEWVTSWEYGAGMTVSMLDGVVSLAVRVDLWLFEKTWRFPLFHWLGFGDSWVLFGDNSGNPLAGAEEYGTKADDVAYTRLEPLAAPGGVANPDPSIKSSSPLGSALCEVIK